MREANREIATHGLKWIDYRDYPIEDERTHLHEAAQLHERITGERPTGACIGRTSLHSQDLVAERDHFEYSADSHADELPYWRVSPSGPQLMVPYTLDANDMRLATPQGFNSGDQFDRYLIDSFDRLYAEGVAGAPKMMSVGLHSRLVGRPGRAAALARFLDHVTRHERATNAPRTRLGRSPNRYRPALAERASRVTEDALPNRKLPSIETG